MPNKQPRMTCAINKYDIAFIAKTCCQQLSQTFLAHFCTLFSFKAAACDNLIIKKFQKKTILEEIILLLYAAY